jgi:PhnB protein
MTGLTPYLSFDGTARAPSSSTAGCSAASSSSRRSAIRARRRARRPHRARHAGVVELFASDAAPASRLELRGILFSLLGTAEPATLEEWFAALAEGGDVLDPLALRPWGDHDGQVRDRFGVAWLIGYQG